MRLADEAATLDAGARLARSLPSLPAEQAGVVYLEGSLGAGKTTLVRGLLRALGVSGSVRSPSGRWMSGICAAHLNSVNR